MDEGGWDGWMDEGGLDGWMKVVGMDEGGSVPPAGWNQPCWHRDWHCLEAPGIQRMLSPHGQGGPDLALKEVIYALIAPEGSLFRH